MLDKSGKSSKYTKYNPNRVTNTQRFIIRSTAVDYLKIQKIIYYGDITIRANILIQI